MGIAILAEQEGFDSIKVSFPSSRERATVHRTVAFRMVQIPLYGTIRNKETQSITDWVSLFLAEQEGFEPSVPFWGTHDFQSCPL